MRPTSDAKDKEPSWCFHQPGCCQLHYVELSVFGVGVGMELMGSVDSSRLWGPSSLVGAGFRPELKND